jgi:hypothetical protein
MITPEEFWAKIEKTDTCWLWTGIDDGRGYGKVHRWVGGQRGTFAVHRISYEWAYGPIPAGLYIDHLCRVPRCVRPDHLEAVTNAENVLRGEGTPARNARKTHCHNGHLLAERTVGRRPRCPFCYNAWRREWRRGRVGAS